MAASGWWGATLAATAVQRGSRGPLAAPGQVAARRVGRGRAGGLCVRSSRARRRRRSIPAIGGSIESRQGSTSTSGSPGFCWSRRSGRRASQKAVHGSGHGGGTATPVPLRHDAAREGGGGLARRGAQGVEEQWSGVLPMVVQVGGSGHRGGGTTGMEPSARFAPVRCAGSLEGDGGFGGMLGGGCGARRGGNGARDGSWCGRRGTPMAASAACRAPVVPTPTSARRTRRRLRQC